jgi:nitrogen fixation protein FixH
MRAMHPWPASIVAAFIVFVSFEVGVIAHIAPGFEGPDDEHYYKHGLEYSEQIRQTRRQQALGYHLGFALPAEVPAAYRLRVSLADAQGVPIHGAHLQASLGRPATRRDDCTRTLEPCGDGVYGVALGAAPGVWDVKLTVRVGGDVVVERRRTRVEGRP